MLKSYDICFKDTELAGEAITGKEVAVLLVVADVSVQESSHYVPCAQRPTCSHGSRDMPRV